MDKRSATVARELADQRLDGRRGSSFFVFIAAFLCVFAIGLLRTAPAFASSEALQQAADTKAVRKFDEQGEEADVIVLRDDDGDDGVALRAHHHRKHGTARDRTGRTGGTKRTDGTGKVRTGKTGNTATLTDGIGHTGRTGDTNTLTDGAHQTGTQGHTLVTDGTGKTSTGRTGDTCNGGYTDGGGNTGPTGDTGYYTDGFGNTGVTGNTVMPTDGRG